MSFEESTVTLGGETREVKSLDFFKLGTVGSTDKKGETTVVCGEYTFLVAPSSLRFRHKPKGARASKPVKVLKTFADLEKLPYQPALETASTDLQEMQDALGNLPEATGKEAEALSAKIKMQEKLLSGLESMQQTEGSKNKNISARSTKEEISMAKLNVEGKQIEIPAAAATVLKKLGIKGDTVELTELDTAVGKAKDKDLEVLSAFEESVQALIQADSQQPPAGKEEKQGADQTPEQGAGAGAQQTPPAGGTPQGSNIFQTQGAGNPGNPRRGNRPEKTEAEKEQERQKRLALREQEAQTIKEFTGRIEELRSENASIADANEAIAALKRLILIDGKVPLFRTLVPSDPRLKAEVKNLVKPADRQYHPLLRGNPEFKKTGKNIEAKYALGEYELIMKESNPSQPTGFFIYVPEALINFTPSKMSLHSEREAILAAETAGSKNLVIKFISKAEMILLLTLLDAPLVLYTLRTKKFDETSPVIYQHSRVDEQQNIPVFSLRAKDSEGRNAKLSIRAFIPMASHDLTKTSSTEFDAVLTTQAIFGRLLFNMAEGVPANKFSQLTQASAALFETRDDGTIVYKHFKDAESVLAYDSTTSRPAYQTVGLPLVKMSTPSTATAIPRPVFVKTKHTDAGYNMKYKADKDAVGDQINKQKRQTNRSIITSHAEEINRMQAIHDILTGNQVKIK